MQTPNQKLPMVLLSALMLVGYTLRADHPPTGARTAALGKTNAAALGSDALFGNQAALASEINPSLIFLYESKFGVAELSNIAAGYIWPLEPGTIGFRFHRFGSGFYSQSAAGISYARLFGPAVSAALQIEYFSLQALEDRVPLRSIALEGGVQWWTTEKLLLAVHIATAQLTEPLNFRVDINSGAIWRIGRDLDWNFGITRNSNRSVMLGSGWELRLKDQAALRLGISGFPLQSAIGFGYLLGYLVLDLTIVSHPYLGLTPIAGIKLNRL